MERGKKVLDEVILVEAVKEKELLKHLLSRLQQQQALSFEELSSMYTTTQTEPTIPLSIFSQNLHPAEALCKFLKEEVHLTNQQAGTFLGRNGKTVWGTYQRAVRKRKQPFARVAEPYVLPLSLFANSKYSILENITHYLSSTYHLPVSTIAAVLSTTPQSVRVLLHRAQRKQIVKQNPIRHGKK